MRIQTPNIPRPKHEDAEYMKVWYKYIDKELECYRISRECGTWRRNFYIVASILFVTVLMLAVS